MATANFFGWPPWILILPKADSDDQLIDKCSDESDQIGGETQTNEKNKWTISSKGSHKKWVDFIFFFGQIHCFERRTKAGPKPLNTLVANSFAMGVPPNANLNP